MDSEVISKEKMAFTIDLLTSLAVDEISNLTGIDANTVLPEFVASKTGMALYDESTKLWWNGPSYIADMYLEEMARNKNYG